MNLTLIIAYQPYIDTSVKVKVEICTVESVLQKLQNNVADRKLDLQYLKITTAESTLIEEDDDVIHSYDGNEIPSCQRIKSYLETVIKSSKAAITEGELINAYYCPDFAKNLIRICQEFPLWTGVTTPYISGHASSSSSEAYFGDIKNLMLKNFTKTLRIDKFVRIHLRDLIGGTRKIDSNLSNFIQKRRRPDSPEEKPVIHGKKEKFGNIVDSNEQENWRNKASSDIFHDHKYHDSTNEDDFFTEIEKNVDDKLNSINKGNENTLNIIENDGLTYIKKNQSQYFAGCPELRIYGSSLPTTKKSKKDIFLINGGLLKGVVIDSEKSNFLLFARNTCAFDSMASILATAAIDNSNFFAKLEANTNIDMFDFVKTLVVSGVGSLVEKSRHQLLYKLYAKTQQRNTIESQNISVSINCWDSARDVWVELFRSQPSAVITIDCKHCKEYEKEYTPKIIERKTISPNHNTIISEGFCNLQLAVSFGKPTRCILCSEMLDQTVILSDQIYIELDVRGKDSYININQHGERCKIRDIPKTICLQNRVYRLAGIVAYMPDHFVAYCWRYNNLWELYNDLLKKKQSATDSSEIEPHGLIYILFENLVL